ncbi:hypothetical protein D9758_010771 [Tetrapyrgos nigripes]|uniref:RING-CH-type domain-containing protein n=1 Tax=Tetrapyrgos nigripes TaxID=182062 RepID=A0A8H5D726_9AGAR|nr:hypothetical protein D9758_010771 [Tetrapyrgos nigripes]
MSDWRDASVQRRVPTIDDLRVKVCFICREEEENTSTSSQGTSPSSIWTHPCKCTLIAHESCLLSWIKSAQTSSKQDALKCPQCQTHYEFDTDLDSISLSLPLPPGFNKSLGKATGKTFHFIGKTFEQCNNLVGYGQKALVWMAPATVVGASFNWALIRYGLWAGKTFWGEVSFATLLPPQNQRSPWITYFNLSLIPLTLVFTQSLSSPLLLEWPNLQTPRFMFPSTETGPWYWYGPGLISSGAGYSGYITYLLGPNWRWRGWAPSLAQLLRQASVSAGQLYQDQDSSSCESLSSPPSSSPLSSFAWPPSPFIVGIVFVPAIRYVYVRLRRRVLKWVLGLGPRADPKTQKEAKRILRSVGSYRFEKKKKNLRGVGQEPGRGQNRQERRRGQDDGFFLLMWVGRLVDRLADYLEPGAIERERERAEAALAANANANADDNDGAGAEDGAPNANADKDKPDANKKEDLDLDLKLPKRIDDEGRPLVLVNVRHWEEGIVPNANPDLNGVLNVNVTLNRPAEAGVAGVAAEAQGAGVQGDGDGEGAGRGVDREEEEGVGIGHRIQRLRGLLNFNMNMVFQLIGVAIDEVDEFGGDDEDEVNDDNDGDDEGVREQGPERNQAQDQNPNQNQGPVDHDPNTIITVVTIRTSRIGLRLAYPLLIPVIARVMGDLLLKFATDARVREFRIMQVFRGFLGVRTPAHVGLGLGLGTGTGTGGVGLSTDPTFNAMLKVLWGGGQAWQAFNRDPVWWRNLLGYGVWVVAKDVVTLLHLYTLRKEFESRRVKNNNSLRGFNGFERVEISQS